MSSIVNNIVTFVAKSTIATVACIVFSTAFVYFVFFGGNKKKSITTTPSKDIKESKTREVKKSDKVSETSVDDVTATKEIDSNATRQIKEKNSFLNDLIQDETPKQKSIQSKIAKVEGLNLGNDEPNEFIKQEPSEFVKVEEPVQEKEKGEPREPFLAEYEASTAMATLVAQDYVAALRAPRPFLAEFEASNAINALIAQEFASNIKVPRPFLAEFEASNALNALVAQEYAANIKIPRPFLAEFEASNAINTLIAQEYAANIKTPRPFLAEFEASNAINTLVAKEYASNLKAPRPFLAEFEASHAMNTLIAQEYTANIPKAPRPFLAEYNASTAINALAAQEYLAKLPKRVPSTKQKETVSTLVQFEATTASCLLEAHQYIAQLELTAPETEFVSAETTTTHQLLHQPFDGELTSSSSSTTSTHSVKTKDINVNNNESIVESPVQEKPFEPFTVNCIYYPNCTNKNCKFIHPGPDNNPKPVKRTNSTPLEPKRPWTRSERIERQSQSHYPVWKSRCVHWPYCTNNHCKYSHPIKECRMGEFCTFKNRCMFLHPSDYIEPLKKQPKQQQTNTPLLKRAQTLG